MNFRLLEDDRRAGRDILQQRHDREHLRDTESDIGQQNLCPALARDNPSLPAVRSESDFLNPEVVNDPKLRQPIGNNLLKRAEPCLVADVPLLAFVRHRQDGGDSFLALDADTGRTRAGPQMVTRRVFA